MELENEPQEQFIENMGNDVLAVNIADKLGYEFSKYVLVKPMPIEKVFKTLTVPEDSGEKDAEGEPIMQMTIKEVETDSKLRRGVVISIPVSIQSITDKQLIVKPGDIIVYPNTRSIDFDLYKDSALVEPYDIVAKVA